MPPINNGVMDYCPFDSRGGYTYTIKEFNHLYYVLTQIYNEVTINAIHQNTYNLGKLHQKYSILQC